MGKKRKDTARQAEFNQAAQVVAPVLLPLLELFAVVDDCFTEEGALSAEHVRKTAGRVYRSWKEVRSQLDPTFDPTSYEKKPRRVSQSTSSLLARELGQMSSTDPKPTSETSQKRSARSERPKPSASAGRVKPPSRASGSPSRRRNRSAYGEE